MYHDNSSSGKKNNGISHNSDCKENELKKSNDTLMEAGKKVMAGIFSTNYKKHPKKSYFFLNGERFAFLPFKKFSDVFDFFFFCHVPSYSTYGELSQISSFCHVMKRGFVPSFTELK